MLKLSMERDIYDIAVIGAGFSGLSVANLLARKYKKILVLEAHSLPGGCGSFFKRDGLSYDVGATTISGIINNGPLTKFLNKIDLDLKFEKVNPALIIHINGKRISRYDSKNDWINTLNKNYPHINNNELWNRIYTISNNSWKIIESSKHFPVKNLTDLKPLFLQDIQTKLSLLKSIFIPLEGTSDKEYNRILNELLLIAAQNTLSNTPEMIAALALTYMDDCWYYKGGVGKFATDLAKHFKDQNENKILYRSKVQSIIKDKNHFKIKTDNNSFRASQVISTLPIWNTFELLKMKTSKLEKQVVRHIPKWGALTLYAKVKTEEKNLYHQIHINKPFKYLQNQSIFVSLANQEDTLKSKNNFRSLNISTHIDINQFKELMNIHGRENIKKLWIKDFKENLCNHLMISEIEIVGFGDPLVFEKYTLRKDGTVGGIAHSLKDNIFSFPNFDIGVKGFYQIGDTTFPGQGIVGTIQGALNLYSRLT